MTDARPRIVYPKVAEYMASGGREAPGFPDKPRC
jgi:hypothetical protein